MSSRLFQEIRENRGLAYSVYSYLPSYIDTGLVVVYAGTNENSFQEVIELIHKEFNRLKEDPFKNRELETAKEQLKGNLLLSLESSDNLMTAWRKMKCILEPISPSKGPLRELMKWRKRSFAIWRKIFSMSNSSALRFWGRRMVNISTKPSANTGRRSE